MDNPTGDTGAAPCEGKILVRGVPTWADGGPYGHTHWDYRCSSLSGQDEREGCADMGGGTPCGHPRWYHGSSSLSGQDEQGGPKWAGGRHVDTPIWGHRCSS